MPRVIGEMSNLVFPLIYPLSFTGMAIGASELSTEKLNTGREVGATGLFSISEFLPMAIKYQKYFL